jgi:hypothetical protein
MHGYQLPHSGEVHMLNPRLDRIKLIAATVLPAAFSVWAGTLALGSGNDCPNTTPYQAACPLGMQPICETQPNTSCTTGDYDKKPNNCKWKAGTGTVCIDGTNRVDCFWTYYCQVSDGNLWDAGDLKSKTTVPEKVTDPCS